MYLAFYQRHPFLGGLTRSLVKYLGITLGWSKRQGWVSNSKVAYKPSSPSIAIYGHTTMKIQLPVRSAKSNIVGCDQYCRGRPGEKPACCSSNFFLGEGEKDKGGFWTCDFFSCLELKRQGWVCKKTRAVFTSTLDFHLDLGHEKDKGGFGKVG